MAGNDAREPANEDGSGRGAPAACACCPHTCGARALAAASRGEDIGMVVGRNASRCLAIARAVGCSKTSVGERSSKAVESRSFVMSSAAARESTPDSISGTSAPIALPPSPSSEMMSRTMSSTSVCTLACRAMAGNDAREPANAPRWHVSSCEGGCSTTGMCTSYASCSSSPCGASSCCQA